MTASSLWNHRYDHRYEKAFSDQHSLLNPTILMSARDEEKRQTKQTFNQSPSWRIGPVEATSTTTFNLQQQQHRLQQKNCDDIQRKENTSSRYKERSTRERRNENVKLSQTNFENDEPEAVQNNICRNKNFQSEHERPRQRLTWQQRRNQTTTTTTTTSRCMNDEELSRFRTQICPKKVAGECLLEERCSFSHCLSFHRRPPHVSGYRPNLCPNVLFTIGSNRKMRVKNYCRRGRACLYSHTKEEQMYHPKIYKTMQCRDWPGCGKQFCPFAHGPNELRNPELVEFDLVAGPEKPEPETMMRKQWATPKHGKEDKQEAAYRKNLVADSRPMLAEENTQKYDWSQAAERLPINCDDDGDERESSKSIAPGISESIHFTNDDHRYSSSSTVSSSPSGSSATIVPNIIPATFVRNTRRIQLSIDATHVKQKNMKDGLARDCNDRRNSIVYDLHTQDSGVANESVTHHRSSGTPSTSGTDHNEIFEIGDHQNSHTQLYNRDVEQLVTLHGHSLPTRENNRNQVDVVNSLPDIRDLIIFEMLMSATQQQNCGSQMAPLTETDDESFIMKDQDSSTRELQNIIDQVQREANGEQYCDYNNTTDCHINNMLEDFNAYYDDQHQNENIISRSKLMPSNFGSITQYSGDQHRSVMRQDDGNNLDDWPRLLASISSITLVTDCPSSGSNDEFLSPDHQI